MAITDFFYKQKVSEYRATAGTFDVLLDKTIPANCLITARFRFLAKYSTAGSYLEVVEGAVGFQVVAGVIQYAAPEAITLAKSNTGLYIANVNPRSGAGTKPALRIETTQNTTSVVGFVDWQMVPIPS